MRLLHRLIIRTANAMLAFSGAREPGQRGMREV
jgi:hypothetical protein